MLNSDSVSKLMQILTGIEGYDSDSLLKKQPWGEIDFLDLAPEVEGFKRIAHRLRDLPLSLLDNAKLRIIADKASQALEILAEINSYSIRDQDANNRRGQIIVRARNIYSDLVTAVSPYMGLLVALSDLNESSFASLKKQAEEDGSHLRESAALAKDKLNEISDLLGKAQTAASSVGVAKFSELFETESSNTAKTSKRWLIAAAFFLFGTISVAIWLWYGIANGSLAVGSTPSLSTSTNLNAGAWVPILEAASRQTPSTQEIIQRLTAKLGILVISFSATVWCGRMFKALQHQSAIYRQKALGLRTFETFHASASAPEVKNAVLLEASRAIFQVGNTGFLEPEASADTKIIEIFRSFTGGNGQR